MNDIHMSVIAIIPKAIYYSDNALRNCMRVHVRAPVDSNAHVYPVRVCVTCVRIYNYCANANPKPHNMQHANFHTKVNTQILRLSLLSGDTNPSWAGATY